MLLKVNKDSKNVIENDIKFKEKKERLKEQLKQKKTELKEKQALLKKQEAYMKGQHENLIRLENKCRKLQTLINEHKAGVRKPDEEDSKTEEDIEKLKERLRGEEKEFKEEKKRYRQMIGTHENIVKGLNLELENIRVELKEKDYESRVNYLKINKLKIILRNNTKAGIKIQKQLETNTYSATTNIELNHIPISEHNLVLENKESVEDCNEMKQIKKEEKTYSSTSKNIDIKNQNSEQLTPYTNQEPLSVFSKPQLNIGRKKK